MATLESELEVWKAGWKRWEAEKKANGDGLQMFGDRWGTIGNGMYAKGMIRWRIEDIETHNSVYQ